MLEAFDSERFEVQSYYRVLAPSGSDDFPWKGIWKPFVPNNVAFFLWVADLGNILTAENLRNSLPKF